MATVAPRPRQDTSPDALFYMKPRLVKHVDDAFIETLTDLYRRELTPGTRIFDMMSSWISHLPPEMSFAHVLGHGMNEEELTANPRLSRHFLQDLNKDQRLELDSDSFDAVLICVSVQYLVYPERVFAEVLRVLRPGGKAIVSFSNRMFPTKATTEWCNADDQGHVDLVRGFLYRCALPPFTPPHASGWADVRVCAQTHTDSDPFFAFVAVKASKAAV